MNSSSKTTLRLVLVDDSEVVRIGLRALLGAAKGIEIVGEADDVKSAVISAEKLKPDVLLLDLRLPDGSGFDACQQILRKSPDIRILILTSEVDERMVDRAIRAGAHGYLLKEINARALVQAIHDVAIGKSILDPSVTARVMQLVKSGSRPEDNFLSVLSSQESRVLALITEGRTNKEVAAEMGLAEKTVKNYLSTVFEKLHVSRRSQAAALYAQQMNRPE
jgi:two-component system response regulator DevR